ncbi:hypothetical protein CBOM_03372 [Ceraceosorus bombacis]|uniref:Uncharacterized protein n=1 Tax=Ceraceosorus bombacis TaxID=401625 RepID=A0A0P1BMD7_9BASI|nr:hypothetical protein CBOM_03372 [Ceraceosorus bombacis]
MMAMMGAPALGLRDVDEPLETRSPKGGRGGFAKDVGANAVGGLAGSIPMMAMMGAPALGLRDVEETGHIHTLMARAPRVPSFLKPKPKPKADPPTPGKPNPAGGPEKEPGMMSNIVGQGVGGLAGSLPFMMMPMGGGGGGGQQPAARDVQNSAQWEDEDGQHLDRRLAGAAVGLLRTGAGALGKMGGSAGMRGIGGDMVGGLAGSAPMMFNNKQ